MPNGIEYQQSRAGANNFNGYISYVSDRKNTLLHPKCNGKTEQNKLIAISIENMLQNNRLHNIPLHSA